MPRLNFTVVEGGAFEAWPKGDYNVRITKIDQKTSKENNHPQLVFSLVPIDGPYEGKKANWLVTLAPNAGFDLPQILEAAIPGEYDAVQAEADDKGNKRVNVDFDSDALIDRVITVANSPRDYQGRDVNNFSKPRAYVPEGAEQPQEQGGFEGAASGTQAAQTEQPQQERTARRRAQGG
jgi:hypothetical protein